MAADPSPSPGPRDEDASPVDDGRRPGAIDAGFLPRGGTPAPGRGGFASGGALETCPPGPALAGFAEDATGPRRDYPGLTDDELIGSMLAWGKLESWAGAGKLSAMAELAGGGPRPAGRPPPAAESPPRGANTAPMRSPLRSPCRGGRPGNSSIWPMPWLPVCR